MTVRSAWPACAKWPTPPPRAEPRRWVSPRLSVITPGRFRHLLITLVLSESRSRPPACQAAIARHPALTSLADGEFGPSFSIALMASINDGSCQPGDDQRHSKGNDHGADQAARSDLFVQEDHAADGREADPHLAHRGDEDDRECVERHARSGPLLERSGGGGSRDLGDDLCDALQRQRQVLARVGVADANVVGADLAEGGAGE